MKIEENYLELCLIWPMQGTCVGDARSLDRQQVLI